MAQPPSEALQRYLNQAVPENTRRAYESDLRHFRAWGGAIPANDRMIAEYLAMHAETLSVATLERRLATLSKAHGAFGYESPTRSHLVKTTLRGIKRCHGRPPKQAKPLLVENLAQIVGAMGDSLRDRRDRALLLVGFYGAFRRSELVAVNVTDVELTREALRIELPRSKTDQERRGRLVTIGALGQSICPIEALQGWLNASGIDEGPVFRAVSRTERLSAGALSPEAVNLILKRRAKAVGLEAKGFSGHSLRAGFVTSAALAGSPAWRIKVQTGHRSDDMLGRYIRCVPPLSCLGTREDSLVS